jgi:ABC-type oligopeptide transport system substrate-binding subunit
MEVVPDVARTWEVRDGGRTYLFRLREDVRWSDGKTITAGDFAYGLRRALDPSIGAPTAGFAYVVKGARAYHLGEGPWEEVGVRVLDPRTLAVELGSPTGYFLHLATHPNWCASPRHAVEAYGEGWTQPENIVTSGPFLLSSWSPGTAMGLQRNPGYHGDCVGNVEAVEISFSPGPLALDEGSLDKYATDDLDVMNFLFAPGIEYPRHRYADEWVSVPMPGVIGVGFDISQRPFHDVRVCRALSLAIDREELTSTVLGGGFSPATGGFVPPGIPGHCPQIGPPYDPQQARRMLADAGYPGGLGFGSPRMLAISAFEPLFEYVQVQWQEKLGVEVALEVRDLNTVAQRLYSREVPPVFSAMWLADYPDPDNFLRAAFQTHHYDCHDAAYWELVTRAQHLQDYGERMRLYSKAERVLARSASVVPLAYFRMNLLVKPWVKYPVSVGGYGFWQDVIIEPH